MIQARALAGASLAGAGITLLFDCYRGVYRSGTRPPSQKMMAAGDLTFWMVGTGLMFLTLLGTTWGELRASMFLAMGGGSLVYRTTAGRFVARRTVKTCRRARAGMAGAYTRSAATVRRAEDNVVGCIKKIETWSAVPAAKLSNLAGLPAKPISRARNSLSESWKRNPLHRKLTSLRKQPVEP